ncbi:bifunctional (p)ppGpp synthetase/guanosine-3',5'-bis(diphosphate) 3'-pyrophosphohydrolase [Viridibacillus sp. YIM B01967]|uniref:Bifunctional (P)ppGpp synthetase/guanosine-3',5'-bis(Diphosphate) 3'-pyrophosphohydrolase n=1 Tax=Viridibacillus soli TaxID=2798301 RepID=A0ABS1HA58_9BACL|nr:HD domain-containing protein [Viridibacillus soli]MBK3496313.1 bifunctional (p)ppGpp synthetase/guanosine-3',5'-bis(diphosphate) 3'-pyrophosphohydrolase [Viridibacillus soli]
MLCALKERLIKMSNYLLKNEIELLEEAINFAHKAHHGQKRDSGEPYITHPLAVCEILLEYKADVTSLISALLHDVLEDTNVSIFEIEHKFGKQVSTIVQGLTKVEKGKFETEEYNAINTEKLLSASLNDIRVAVIKITDRLHNMRTLAVKKVEKKIPYANETINFFSPLAERLGLYKFQEELEELGFSYLNPPKFNGVKKIINNYSIIFEDIFNKCSEEVKREGDSLIIDLEWIKTPSYKSYSLLEEERALSELFSIKVITSKINCYNALGVIHSLYTPIEHHLIDNIAVVKSPFLKQLNTKVLINNVAVNIIIQSECDKKLNDTGVFELLKDDLTNREIMTLSRNLLGDSILTVKSITNTSIEFYDLIAFELFQSDITVCTPKMEVILLPKGSTIIDFAFSLNPKLATSMSYARVNGEIMPINTVINDMDIVEILTTNKKMVRSDWLIHAQTSKAIKEINEVLNM